MSRTTRRYATGAIIAALAGYVAGILTAPKSGKETRRDIRRGASKAKTDAERKLKKLYGELHKLTEQGSRQIKKLKTRGKTDLKEAVDKGYEAKEKARELLTALHEGDADDQDLQAAIKDVKDAIAHLKTFAKKNTRGKAK